MPDEAIALPAQPAPKQTPVILDTLAISSMIPQMTPDYTMHKLLMYETILFTNAKRVLETGTDVGDSARIFATALRRTGGILFTIDSKTNLNCAWGQEYPNIMFMQGDSLQVKWENELDVFYADSGHTKEHLLAELRKFGPWVRKGGVILCHDTCHSEFSGQITEAIRTFCRDNSLRWSEDPNPHGMAIIEMTRDLAAQRK